RLFTLDVVERPGLLMLGLGSVVVLHRGDGLVERDLEVVVEVTGVGRIPGERPALARLVRLDLRQRSARDHGERGVTGVQVPEQAVADLVHPGRATGAALV